MEHGFAGFNEGGEVKHGVKGVVTLVCRGKDCFDGLAVGQFALNELNAGGQQLAPAMAQIVENDGVMAIPGKQGCDSTTYVPGAAGYKNFHKKCCPFELSLGNLKSITVVCGQTAGRSSRSGLPQPPLTLRSHDANNHATVEQRIILMLPFRDRGQELPVAFKGSRFLLPGALDLSWSRKIVRGTKESKATASRKRWLTARDISGIYPLAAINKNLNIRLNPFVCMLESSLPALAAGNARKFGTGSEMGHATWNGNRKLTLKSLWRQKTRTTVCRQPEIEQFCAIRTA
jgi:hypothetical protein